MGSRGRIAQQLFQAPGFRLRRKNFFDQRPRDFHRHFRQRPAVCLYPVLLCQPKDAFGFQRLDFRLADSSTETCAFDLAHGRFKNRRRHKARFFFKIRLDIARVINGEIIRSNKTWPRAAVIYGLGTVKNGVGVPRPIRFSRRKRKSYAGHTAAHHQSHP